MTIRMFVPCTVRDVESSTYNSYTRPDGSMAQGGTSYSVVMIDSDENKSKLSVPVEAFAQLGKLVGRQVQLVLDFVQAKGRNGHIQFVGAQEIPQK